MKDTHKIKQTLTITIVDENGSRQFAVVKILQRIVVYGSLFLLIAIISGYFAMSLFIAKLDDITSAKQDVYREFRSIQEQNAFLRDDIQNKSEELQAMQDKVSDLEKIVNMRSFVAEENKIEEQEIDLQQLANMQKATILQIIPNGSPVDLFEMKQKAKEKYKDAHSLINAGYAAQNISNIGYNYYTGRSEPVYATADGIVESIRDDNQRYGYGNLVRLSHVLGFSTAYTNLEKVSVKKGDFVSKGNIIGYTTASPGKNYISLYYEVRFLSESLDTLSFIDWDKHNFESIFDARKNSNIDLKSFMWALNDIVKLNNISTHFAYTDIENFIAPSAQITQSAQMQRMTHNNLFLASNKKLIDSKSHQ